MITITWHGLVPVDNIDGIELAVLEDIKRSLTSLDKPSDLIYHLVPLGDDYDGPSVTVWGEAGDDDHFHCEYQHETEWVSLNEVDDND